MATVADTVSVAPILLYDGKCGLYDRTVAFILQNDRRKVLRFSPLQGETARPILERHGLPTEGDFDTLVLVEDPGLPSETVSVRSTAALRISRLMGRRWGAVSRFGGLVPRGLRDVAYRWVAANRHTYFPMPETCRIPSPAERAWFLP